MCDERSKTAHDFTAATVVTSTVRITLNETWNTLTHGNDYNSWHDHSAIRWAARKTISFCFVELNEQNRPREMKISFSFVFKSTRTQPQPYTDEPTGNIYNFSVFYLHINDFVHNCCSRERERGREKKKLFVRLGMVKAKHALRLWIMMILIVVWIDTDTNIVTMEMIMWKR